MLLKHIERKTYEASSKNKIIPSFNDKKCTLEDSFILINLSYKPIYFDLQIYFQTLISYTIKTNSNIVTIYSGLILHNTNYYINYIQVNMTRNVKIIG